MRMHAVQFKLRGFALACCAVAAAAAFPAQAAHLEYVTEVGGTITDVTSQRILFFVVEDGRPVLRVYNRVTGSLRTVPDQTGHTPGYEKLTARGIVYGITEDDETSVYEWNGGTAPIWNDGTPRGMFVSPNNKRYVIWPSWRPGRYLNLRDVLAYTDTQIGNGKVIDTADVSDSGDVVYSAGPAPYTIFRYRNGQTVQLTNDGSHNFNPLTDGINVVYRKQITDSSWRIVMYNESVGEVVLRGTSSTYFSPHLDYFPSNGWVAFTNPAVPTGTSYRRIYQRSPSGQITTVSPAGVDAYILAAWGAQVMYVSKGYLYLARPGTTPVLVAPYAEGTGSAYLQGAWYVHFGGGLYRVKL